LDFLIRLRDNYKDRILKCILAKHITHSGNITATLRAQSIDYHNRLFAKRVRKMFKLQKIKREHFILAAYILHAKYLTGTTLTLAKIFYSRYPGIKSAYLLGLSYCEASRFSKAIKLMKAVINYKAKSYKEEFTQGRKIKEFAYTLLGMLYASKRKYDLSITYLCRGLAFYPGSNLLKLELFHAYLESGKEDFAQKMLKETSNRALRFYMEGAIFLYKKDYQEAKKSLHKANNISNVMKYRLYFSLGKLDSEMNR